jgi:nucleotide-binding universal stress UspA family protein
MIMRKTGMSYKTVLVSLNSFEQQKSLLQVCSVIARQNDAHVIGLYVVPAVRVYGNLEMAAPIIVSDYHDHFEKKLQATREQFEKFIKAEGLKGEWHAVKSNFPDLVDSTVAEAKKADLVIVGHTLSQASMGEEKNILERLVMETGRPVLIVPGKGKIVTFESSLTEKAIIGVNGSRESSRALFDAIPLLKNCDEVRVVWVDPYKHRDEAGEIPGVEEAALLARHGIKAVAEAMMADGRDPAEALSMRAKDLGAGLVVLGAYGHSRLREYVFGGTTRHMLLNMDVPVLMSH